MYIYVCLSVCTGRLKSGCTQGGTAVRAGGASGSVLPHGTQTCVPPGRSQVCASLAGRKRKFQDGMVSVQTTDRSVGVEQDASFVQTLKK